ARQRQLRSRHCEEVRALPVAARRHELPDLLPRPLGAHRREQAAPRLRRRQRVRPAHHYTVDLLPHLPRVHIHQHIHLRPPPAQRPHHLQSHLRRAPHPPARGQPRHVLRLQLHHPPSRVPRVDARQPPSRIPPPE